MAEPTFYDAPRKMWLRKKHTNYMREFDIIGETSRSWLEGYRFRPDKYSKRDYEACAEAEYREWQWANRNRHKIGNFIQYDQLPPATLRKIAELIGYVEQPDSRGSA